MIAPHFSIKGRVGGPHRCGWEMRKKRGIQEILGDGDVSSSSRDPFLSRVVDRSLEVAMNVGNTFTCSPLMPWDEGFLKDVLGTQDSRFMPWLAPLSIPRDCPPFVPPAVTLASSVSDKVQEVRKRFSARASFSHDVSRLNAISRWMDLVLLYPNESQLGRILMSETDKNCDSEKVVQIITDWMARKSTSTLTLRAGSMAMYVKYCDQFGAAAVPVDEMMAYQYVDFLRSTGKPPTRARTFVSTLSFVGGILGWKGAEDAANSQLVQGAAHRCYLQKRVLRQAPPLDVVSIAVLELCSLFDEGVYLRACAGLCLFALYGRLRVSDCNRVCNGKVSGNYFEGNLCRVKTARTLEKQTRFLPLIVPVRGLLGFDWFSSFQQARRDLGLEDIPEFAPDSTDNEFVLFPSQATVCLVSPERIGSAEMTERLKECLSRILPLSAFSRYTSHSLKCTLLTYTNVFGLTLEQNELLGYHVVKGHSSALNYSRDALASPIRAMMTMLQGVRIGTFKPLAPRDEQFCSKARAEDIREQFQSSLGMSVQDAAEVIFGILPNLAGENKDFQSLLVWLNSDLTRSLDAPVEDGYGSVEEIFDFSDDNESEYSSSDSGSTSAEEGMAVVERQVAGYRYENVNVHADLSRMFRHVRTKMLHYAHVDDMHKTCCGRIVSESFSVFKDDPESAWPKCRVCWGR